MFVILSSCLLASVNVNLLSTDLLPAVVSTEAEMTQLIWLVNEATELPDEELPPEKSSSSTIPCLPRAQFLPLLMLVVASLIRLLLA